MKITLALLVAGVALAGNVACAEDIIVESRQGGINTDRYKEVEGAKWMDSNSPPARTKSTAPGLSPQTLGSRKYVFSLDTTTTRMQPLPHTARFLPKVTAPGKYHVYVTWPSAGNATPVTWTVKHAKGEDQKVLEQDGWGGKYTGGNGNVWTEVGVYDFTPGDDQYAEVHTGEDVEPLAKAISGQVFADAVRFTTEALSPAQVSAKPKPPAAAAVIEKPSAPDDANYSAMPIDWYYDIATAQGVAAEKGKRILVFFFKQGSVVSDSFEELFRDPAIRGVVNANYIPVRLEFSVHAEVAARLSIVRGGTLAWYDSTGKNLGMASDRMTATELVDKLKLQ